MAGHLGMSPTQEGRKAGVCVIRSKNPANAEIRHEFGTMHACKDAH